VPDMFDDGEPSEADFALPGDEQYNPHAEATEVADEPAPLADTAVEETPVAETDAEPEAEKPTRERGPDGKFIAKQPDEPEEIDEPLFAGKYKSAQDLEAAYTELQSRLGTQGQELGEMRRLMDERLEQIQTQTRPQTPVPTAEALQEHLYDNTHEIIPTIQNAHAAALRGDQNAEFIRDTALATLRELSGVEAERQSRWIVTTQIQAQQQQAATAASQNDVAWNQAAKEFAESHPDINQFAPQMMELAQQSEWALRTLESGDPKARVGVLDYLYTKARGQTSDTLTTASKTIAREQALAADEAIREASVASASTAVPARELTPKEKDEMETFAIWDAEDEKYSRGWNI
jgi:hypothetical protein